MTDAALGVAEQGVPAVVVDTRLARDVSTLADIVAQHGVTRMVTVPSVLQVRAHVAARGVSAYVAVLVFRLFLTLCTCARVVWLGLV